MPPISKIEIARSSREHYSTCLRLVYRVVSLLAFRVEPFYVRIFFRNGIDKIRRSSAAKAENDFSRVRTENFDVSSFVTPRGSMRATHALFDTLTILLPTTNNVRRVRPRFYVFLRFVRVLRGALRGLAAEISPEPLRAVPQVLQTRSELETEVLVVSRYVVAAHRGDAFLLGCVLALRVTTHRLRRAARRRRRVARQGIIIVRRRRASSAVLTGRRLHVEHGCIRLDVRVDLKPTARDIVSAEFDGALSKSRPSPRICDSFLCFQLQSSL